MDKIRSQLRVDFLGYVEDNWKQDFYKLQKSWKRPITQYVFDEHFTTYLRLVRYYGYDYSEWDLPQTIYDVALDLLAQEVVHNIDPI